MTAPPPSGPQKGHPLTRPMFFVAGLALTAIGIAGYLLPVLPGTIFLIMAAACFARSSRRLEAWLLNHPKLGPSVRAWRESGAIPRRIKLVAIGMMAVSFTIVAVAHPPTLWLVGVGIVLLACALFVATRPDGPRTTG